MKRIILLISVSVLTMLLFLGCPVTSSNDATLKSITITDPSGLNLSPTFNAKTTAYTITITDETEITLEYELNDSTATVESIKYNASEQTISNPITFTGLADTNTIIILVLAADKSTSKTYTITVAKSSTEYTVSGTVTVPEGSYFAFVKVGLFLKSTDTGDVSSKIQQMRRLTNDPFNLVGNLYYYNNAGADVSIEADLTADLTGASLTTKNYTITLPTDLPGNTGRYFIAAWYDDNTDDSWDVKDANNFNGVAGSEYIRLPVKESLVQSGGTYTNACIGGFYATGSTVYFDYSSDGGNAMSSAFGTFYNTEELTGVNFTFTTNTY